MIRKIKLIFALLLVLLPSAVKVFVFRSCFGYKIGARVKIGFSLLLVDHCVIADDVTIGHLNVIIDAKLLKMGPKSIIGHLNILRGGEEIDIGAYAQIFRLNEINSIVNPLLVNEADPRLFIGEGAVITAWHKIDFTDRVTIGNRVVLAGRNSSLWTHNRQMTKPVSIGDNCYVGSGIQMVPGSALPAYCVIGVSSVITKVIRDEYTLIAGIPARVVKRLDEDGLFLVNYPTRPDLPENV